MTKLSENTKNTDQRYLKKNTCRRLIIGHYTLYKFHNWSLFCRVFSGYLNK